MNVQNGCASTPGGDALGNLISQLTGVQKASDKATLPGSRHHSGGLYTLKTDDAGNFPDPRCAPERLLAAIAAGYRWVGHPRRTSGSR